MIDRSFYPQSTGAGGWQAPDRDRAVVKALTDEVLGRVTGVRRTDVRAQVVAALRDLQGSVSHESIAEMAVRLAEHRLSSMVSADPFQDSGGGSTDGTAAPAAVDPAGDGGPAVWSADQHGGAGAGSTRNQGTVGRATHPASRDDDHGTRPYRRAGHHPTRP